MKLDAHAHQKSDSTQILVGVHTLGIHPWELLIPFNRDHFDEKWNELISNKKTEIYAIGECGLDRVHEGIADIEDQKYVLMKHFELATQLEVPIILHSVRAYSDVLEILKKIKFKYPILLHAYGGNEHEMHELLKYPVYFSYGARLFKTDKMLKLTSLDRLLLETGDQLEFSIADIYQKASESLGIDPIVLEERLEKNFLTFFRKHDDVSTTDFINNLNACKTRA
jgi:TatD DNase family protein